MSNEQQIHNLIARYTHYVDQARFDKVGDLFANGKIISPGNVMEGKDGVVSQLAKKLQVYADGTLRTAHLTTNTVLDIQEDTDGATAVSYLTILQADAERGLSLQPIAVGRYHDTFRCVDGRWEFSVRELIITLAGDLSHHAMPNTIDLQTVENRRT